MKANGELYIINRTFRGKKKLYVRFVDRDGKPIALRSVTSIAHKIGYPKADTITHRKEAERVCVIALERRLIKSDKEEQLFIEFVKDYWNFDGSRVQRKNRFKPNPIGRNHCYTMMNVFANYAEPNLPPKASLSQITGKDIQRVLNRQRGVLRAPLGAHVSWLFHIRFSHSVPQCDLIRQSAIPAHTGGQYRRGRNRTSALHPEYPAHGAGTGTLADCRYPTLLHDSTGTSPCPVPLQVSGSHSRSPSDIRLPRTNPDSYYRSGSRLRGTRSDLQGFPRHAPIDGFRFREPFVQVFLDSLFVDGLQAHAGDRIWHLQKLFHPRSAPKDRRSGENCESNRHNRRVFSIRRGYGF